MSIVIVGCATKSQIVERDKILFKGDSTPLVRSSDAIKGNLKNLSDGETLVVAIAGDGTGALSQPSLSEVLVQETILESDENNLDLILSRCDPDGDGILDFYCPDLVNSMNSGVLANEKYVSFQSWYLISKDLDNHEDHWQDRVVIDVSKVKDREVPVFLKLITVNRGNMSFNGDLTIYGKAPPQMKIQEITEYNKIEDQTGTKESMNSIPIVSWFSGVFDNYAIIDSSANFKTERDESGHAKLIIEDINIEPGQGVTLEFTAVYTVTDR